MLEALWNYRGVIFDKVKQDFLGKYKRSVLGASWIIIEPLSMIIIYTLIFSNIIGTRLPNNSGEWSYSIYLCSGLLCWELFQNVIFRSSGMFIEHANLIKKANFPRSILPVVVSINGFIHYFIFLTLLMVFLFFTKQIPYNSLIYLPIGLLALLLIAGGAGLVLGILNVFFRDIGRLVLVGMNFLFWGTPIVYTLEVIPERLSSLILMLNPIAMVIEYHHTIFIHDVKPNIELLLTPFILGTVFCLFGFWLFMKLAGDIVDEL